MFRDRTAIHINNQTYQIGANAVSEVLNVLGAGKLRLIVVNPNLDQGLFGANFAQWCGTDRRSRYGG